MSYQYGEEVRIEILQGGFVLSYPVFDEKDNCTNIAREVIASERKLVNRVKEIIAQVSLVPNDKE